MNTHTYVKGKFRILLGREKLLVFFRCDQKETNKQKKTNILLSGSMQANV